MTDVLASRISQTAATRKSRMVWIDAAKAFAICFVVFGHVFRGVYDAGLMTDSEVFRWIDNSIYLFHMPLFFFLSGITFAGQKHPWPDFLRRLSRAIIPPYVIWSIALVAIKSLGQASVNHPVGFVDLLGIAYAPISPFWFFYALFLIQLAARIAIPLIGPGGVLALSILAFLAHFQIPSESTPIDFALEFFLYFSLGLALQPLRSRPLRIGRAGACAAAFLFLAPPLLCLLWRIDYITLPGRLAAVPMILAASAFLIWLGEAGHGRAWPIQLTGQATLAIYCLHIFFTGTIRAALLHFGVVDLTPHLVAGTLLGIVLPIAIQLVATRLGIAGWLGFPRLSLPGRSGHPDG